MNRLTILWLRIRKRLGTPKLLCDSCLYDYPSACSNPDRPNATECPDYTKKGGRS